MGLFVREGMGQVLSEPPNACVCSVLQVGWCWQVSEVFRQLVMRWFWTRANMSVLENRLLFSRPQKELQAVHDSATLAATPSAATNLPTDINDFRTTN